MAEEKRKRKVSVVWQVLKETDGLYEKLYSGPDKKKTREIAGKALQSGKVEKVIVARLASVTVLTPDDLKASLPKEAF